METVGIRELKANLSKYVAQMRKGKRFIITDRGEEIGELTPISAERRLLKDMVKQGLAKWDGGKPKGSRPRIKIKGKPMSDTVLEDRR